MRIYRGRIVGLFRTKESALALLGIEDDVRGRVLIPCDGNPTCRMLDIAFPGALRDGTFHNSAIEGERIFYELDDVGVLRSFGPVDRVPDEIIERYEKQGTHTRGGFAPPDHQLFSIGPIVAGREILKPQDNGTVKVTARGFLPPDHPIYSRGPMIFGRNLPPTPKKKLDDN